MRKIQSRSGRIVQYHDITIPTDFGRKYQKELLESDENHKVESVFRFLAKNLLLITMILILLTLMKNAL